MSAGWDNPYRNTPVGGSKPSVRPPGGKAASLVTNEKPPRVAPPKKTPPKKVALPPSLGGPGKFSPTPAKVHAFQKANPVPKAAPKPTPVQQYKARQPRAGGSAQPGLPSDYGNPAKIMNPRDLATLQRIGKNPHIHNIASIVGDPAGLIPAVQSVVKFAQKPGVGTGLGAGLSAAGLLPIGKGLRAAKELAPVVEDTSRAAAEAGKLAPHMTPEAAQMRDVLPGAKVVRGKTDAGYSPQRSSRAATGDAIFKDTSLSVPDRMAKVDAAMGGPLDKPKYTGMSHFTPLEVQDFQKQAMEHPTLPFYQRLRVVKSLENATVNGIAPTRSDLKLYQKVWGKNQANQIFGKAGSGIWQGLLSIANIPRSLMSTLDQSFGFRQGLVAAFYDPKNWWKSYSGSFSYLTKHLGGTGEEGFQKLQEDIHGDPDFHELQQGGLAMTDLEHEAGLREEPYQSTLAEKAVIGRNAEGKIRLGVEGGHGPGNAIRGSGRGYTGATIANRFVVAKHLLGVMRDKGIANEQNIKDMTSFVNAITGRGNLPGKVLQESAPLINALLFSPRLLGSRIQMLTEPFNIALMRRNPYIWRQYVKANAKTFGTLGLILATVRQFVPGAHVSLNPRSSDFGKIKVGDTRIDLLGGFNQVFHQIGEQVTGEKISSTTGKLTSLTSGKYGSPTRFDEFQNFLIGKESPTPGIITDLLRNKNPNHFGKKFNLWDEAKTKLWPLSLQDAYGTFSDPGSGNKWLEGLAAYLASGTGIGVQTYGPQKPNSRFAPPSSPSKPSSSKTSGGWNNPYSP